ncbi:MAG: DUF4412 domain-containing protein [Bacteroidetes bacterium]|nr:DUF4412 domain-containing protein [Bacteroidota bacterium]MCW5896219.1 DUF4412 domain-containing protein [Bacteroidota bacterium]
MKNILSYGFFLQRQHFPIHHKAKMLVGAVFAAFVIAARANAQFEGVVESKNTSTNEFGQPHEFVMTMWIKKDMVKIETRSETFGSTMIYRTDKRRIWMLNADDKSYFEISQDEKPQEMIAPGGTTAKYSIKRTGKTKTIAGYKSEQFIIKRETEQTELWGTKSLSQLVTTLSKALGQEHAEATEGATAEVMKMGIYPLASATKIDGVLAESQEVTRIEQKKLDPLIFELPAGYKKQKSVEFFDPAGGEKK